jgi:hypothetical protein
MGRTLPHEADGLTWRRVAVHLRPRIDLVPNRLADGLDDPDGCPSPLPDVRCSEPGKTGVVLREVKPLCMAAIALSPCAAPTCCQRRWRRH